MTLRPVTARIPIIEKEQRDIDRARARERESVRAREREHARARERIQKIYDVIIIILFNKLYNQLPGPAIVLDLHSL